MRSKRFSQAGILATTLIVLPAGHAADRKLDPHEQTSLVNCDDLGFNVYSG